MHQNSINQHIDIKFRVQATRVQRKQMSLNSRYHFQVEEKEQPDYQSCRNQWTEVHSQPGMKGRG